MGLNIIVTGEIKLPTQTDSVLNRTQTIRYKQKRKQTSLRALVILYRGASFHVIHFAAWERLVYTEQNKGAFQSNQVPHCPEGNES